MMSTVIVKIQPLLTYWSDPALAKLLRQDLKGWLDPRLSDKPFLNGARLAHGSLQARQGARCRNASGRPLGGKCLTIGAPHL